LRSLVNDDHVEHAGRGVHRVPDAV
jgi:hypothetical protein